jgi:phosphoenolpyruvate carboxylase
VTRPIGRDRAKVTAQKGKEKKGSSSQSESSSALGDIMFILKELSTSFTKTQLWKQYNKLKDRSTANMDEEKLESHHKALRLIQKNLQFTQQNVTDIEDEDDE